MSDQTIQLEGDGTYLPGARVSGQLHGDRIAGEVRLFWRTTGRGTTEVGVVDKQAAGASGHFELSLPLQPYSVSGTLLSIEWGLEWVDESGEPLCFQGVVVSPTRSVVELGRVKKPESGKASLFDFRSK